MSEPKVELPSGFERTGEGPRIKITKDDLPWLETDEEIQLKKVSLVGGGEFFLGSVIRGDKLKMAAKQLDKHRKKLVDNMFYARLPTLITEKYNPTVRTLKKEGTKRSIHCVSNKGGQRVYFMRLDDFESVPVIIRLAVCDKAKQAQVLSVLSGKSISKVGKGRIKQ